LRFAGVVKDRRGVNIPITINVKTSNKRLDVSGWPEGGILKGGESATLITTTTPETTDPLTYGSSDEDVVTVSDTGVLTAGNKKGTAEITVTCGSETITKTITVNEIPNKVLTVSGWPAGNTLKGGETATIKPTTTIGTTDPVTYTSSNPNVVSVSNTGVLTAGSQIGIANITVKCGEKTIEQTITVKEISNQVLAVKGWPKKNTLKKKKSVTLKVTKTANTTDKVTFTTSNKKVIKVTATGKLTATKKKGKAKITVKCGTKTVVKTIKVK
jgi:uncharacterized protein YjdB